MHVDPIKPTLTSPGIKRLTLEYDELLSSFSFKFNLRRYIKDSVDPIPHREGLSSQTKGVSFNRSLGKWVSACQVDWCTSTL